MQQPTFDQRILVNVAASLSHQFVDSDGTAAAPGGTVTVDIATADGTALVTGGATTGSGSDPRVYALSAVNNDQLDWLTVTWKDGGTAVASSVVEVVGGYYASLAAIRAEQPALNDLSRYSDARLLKARSEAEGEAEDVARVAFVPRFDQARVMCRGGVVVLRPRLRSVRAVRYSTDGTTWTTLDSALAATIQPSYAGIAYLPSGWPAALLEVDYEHGHDRPPADLLRLWYNRVRWWARREAVAVGDEVASYVTPDGTSITVASEFGNYFAKLGSYGFPSVGVA